MKRKAVSCASDRRGPAWLQQELTAIPLLLAMAVFDAEPAMAKPDRAMERAAAALDLRVDRFTLANGLRVIVHTDRKAPVVSVSVQYGVGAKYEAPDRSGFAHLFEHLMFNGSDNAPGDFFRKLRDLGATGVNGNTLQDYTLFYETVPRGALERVLFLEADRMGHMERAIDQRALDANRRIVQNEKRQNDNQPNGVAYYRTFQRLFPPGHPYGHPIAGSMAALDAASIHDVRDWHRRYYRPGNAVLVLAGDIDAVTARTLAERYFGDLPGGSPVAQLTVPIPVLDAPIGDVEHDRVAGTTVTRHWLTPGLRHRDAPALDVAAKILGTLTGSWLDGILLRDERLVTSLTTSSGASADIATFIIDYTIAPGVDPQRVADRLDTLLARFAHEGPSEDQIRRVVMREIGWKTQTLEATGPQATTLGEGVLLEDDPMSFRSRLLAQARLRPVDVADVVRRWLLRPAYTLTVEPGPRPSYAEAAAGKAAPPALPAPAPSAAATARPAPANAALPPIAPTAPLRFPTVERTRLSNGIEIVHVRRPGVPLTRVALTFDAGEAADPPDGSGGQSLLLAMLTEGNASRDAAAIARARQRLGADLGFETTKDQSIGTLTVPSASFAPALALFADVVRHPAMTPAALARVGADRLAGIRGGMNQPDTLAQRAMAPLLYGDDSPYDHDGRTGDTAAIAGLTRERLLELHGRWLRPDTARLFVVSDLPLATVRAQAERVFGDWRGQGTAGRVVFTPRPQASSRIMLIDRPGSPQSLILAAVRAPLDGPYPLETLFASAVANEALGGFRGRINADLRERLGWSYGTRGSFQQWAHALSYSVVAPVQADRTGAAIGEIRRNLSDYVGNRPITPDEFDGAIRSGLASLPGRYESGAAILDALRANQLLGRPDDYQTTLAERYRVLDRDAAAGAMRRTIDPARMLWVVVGDAQRVRPQLDALGLPVIDGLSGR